MFYTNPLPHLSLENGGRLRSWTAACSLVNPSMQSGSRQLGIKIYEYRNHSKTGTALQRMEAAAALKHGVKNPGHKHWSHTPSVGTHRTHNPAAAAGGRALQRDEFINLGGDVRRERSSRCFLVKLKRSRRRWMTATQPLQETERR